MSNSVRFTRTYGPSYADLLCRLLRSQMLQEIELMKEIGSHPHVVSFIGYVALECPLIVMEYCAEGDLLNYLRTHLQTHKESIAHVGYHE